MKDLGPVHYLLGKEVHRDKTGLYLSQGKYISNLLSRFEMSFASPCQTPMAAHKSLSVHSSEPLSDSYKYRNVVGALQYL